MASIGPQIPGHLLRQRQSSQIEAESSDEEAGPSVEPSAGPAVGPQIPTHLKNQTSSCNVVESADDEEDDYGPTLPPDLAAKRPGVSSNTTKESPPARSPPPKAARRVVGPTLPDRGARSYSDDDEDVEDEYGPMPLQEGVQKSDGVSEGVREFMEREERRRKEAEEAAKPKKLKREEWMLVPPSSSDLLGHLSDPTKLKARQFSRGVGAAARSAPNNLWTETPEERQQRIADEVVGKKRRAANAEEDVSDDRDFQRKQQRDMELQKVVEEHNKSSRGKSLLQMHESEKKKQKKSKSGEEESVAIWDHTRDMSVGGRLMDEKQRSKMISESRSLGDRFGSGKSGGYL